jgi:hypothetical protein
MRWDMGSMVRPTKNIMDAQQQRTIADLSGTMAQAGTSVGPSQFGSGITLPAASPSSQAIAGFANLAPQGGGWEGGTQGYQPPTPQQGGPQPLPTAPTPPPPSGIGVGYDLSQQAQSQLPGGDAWWAAVRGSAEPGAGSVGPQPIAGSPEAYDAYQKQMGSYLDYAKGQGMADTSAYSNRLAYQGPSMYGGGDPAAAYQQYMGEQQRQQQVAAALAAQGAPSWSNPTPGGRAPG